MNLKKIAEYFYPHRILDIGANAGMFHRGAKEAFPDAYIFSIEASEECEPYLKQITEDYYIGLLAADKNTYKFYSRKDAPTGTGNSIYRELTHFYRDENLEILEKESIPLDDLFDEKDTFDLIKIDTQGSELDIIRGGRNLCSRAKGILLEVSVIPYNKGAPLKPEVLEFMDSIGYREAATLDSKKTGTIHQEDVLFLNESEEL